MNELEDYYRTKYMIEQLEITMIKSCIDKSVIAKCIKRLNKRLNLKNRQTFFVFDKKGNYTGVE